MGDALATRRRRKCQDPTCLHRFMTYEVHAPAWTVAKSYAAGHAKTLLRRWAFLARDKAIAAELHKGWEPIARRLGLSRSAVYLAARHGRAASRVKG